MTTIINNEKASTHMNHQTKELRDKPLRLYGYPCLNIKLSRKDALNFLDALDEPRPMNQYFQQAACRYKKTITYKA
ncbi:hypothetical protein [Vibrio sp. MACH09]|uniref:hypothetical protein n=1 Tax=Vibrio sp. MACH09 TaxID=3025122 RepID=UPI00295E7924|nr:hypothetical protein [Vibrio sp. MACH09]